ncbi:CHAT domain-containing protein [Flavilitoribacter nigricans]|uniref:CHAT domain-containing protein n=1 Tax=Flavilitoribacter nigricans (strain ATCC 23147 / DSM 23189 / NBRC 102662 / NCIMB 1420 / SS-2) TaxID=1122177 RepID=A0A2D0MZ87_FLAN2|nr:CHAT domain-containing protein [Flavilitoribacter nigricans]PHN01565.1 hypothetical protein CRP01_36300 [Flavilitoribacter nigricans DSM 23189 = NBRC 102662]
MKPGFTEMKLNLPLYLIIFLVVQWALSGCTFTDQRVISEKIIDVYSSSPKFSNANNLRYKRYFFEAANAYREALISPDLNREDSLFALNQIIYCHLIVNKTKDLEDYWVKTEELLARTAHLPPVLLADYHFNKGRYYLLQQAPDSALMYSRKALQAFYRLYPPGHIKTAQGLTLIPLVLMHYDQGNLIDSIHYYALQLNNIFLKNPEIEPYDWEMDYVLGFSSLLDRAHERGTYHGQRALERIKALPTENKWLEARAWGQLGNMVKKRGDALIGEDPVRLHKRKSKLYHSADSIFKKAIAIAEANQDEGLMTFYENWIINVCRFGDSTAFFASMDLFEQTFRDRRGWRPHYNRLLGYYNILKDPDKMIKYYTAFLSQEHEDPYFTYWELAEAYYCLRMANGMLNQFDNAAFFAKKSLILYGCIEEGVDIRQPEAVTRMDSTRSKCLITSGYVAEEFFKNYLHKGDLQDLKLADAYFDFAVKHSVKSLLHVDEDAFLTYQFEAGNKTYSKALEAAFEGWSATRDLHWQDKALQYMEFLKSFLLYRDMLKQPGKEEKQYSLTDSIRILQGQLNQLLFSLNTEKKNRSDHLDNDKLVGLLRKLEYRRRERLSSFTSNALDTPQTVTDIQKYLGKSRGVIHYYSAPGHLFGMYVDSDTSILFRETNNYSLLREAVEDYRKSIEEAVVLDENTVSRYVQSARILYDILIGPFADRLSRIDQLVIIPDQLLDPIPFEAFLSIDPDSTDLNFKTLPYLLLQVETVYASSWKTFKVNQEKKQLDFRNQTIGFWTTPELNNTNGLQVIEQAIQSGFKDNYHVFNQQKGGKQIFLENHDRFDVLHLLLHARSSRSNRYDNQINFGEGPEERLYGFELYKQKFKGKLLILASCESATGAPQAGEGTFSLARSFTNSGIPEIIAAQFLIPQTTTGPLLNYFYAHLMRGKNATAALHRAKLEYLDAVTKKRHAYPRFWAGMVALN